MSERARDEDELEDASRLPSDLFLPRTDLRALPLIS